MELRVSVLDKLQDTHPLFPRKEDSDTGVRFEIAVRKVVFSRAFFWDGISNCRNRVVTGASSRLPLSKGGFVSVLSHSCKGNTFDLSLPQDVAISPRQRDEVIQWLAKLKYQFHLYPETLALAISLLDRFLAAVKVNICSTTDWNRLLPRRTVGVSSAGKQKRFLPPAPPRPAHTGVGSACCAGATAEGLWALREPGLTWEGKGSAQEPQASSTRDRPCLPPWLHSAPLYHPKMLGPLLAGNQLEKKLRTGLSLARGVVQETGRKMGEES